MPYLFTALKIAATASIVGAIIGEDRAGSQEGLGRAIISFNQHYMTGPEKLWATIFVARCWASSSSSSSGWPRCSPSADAGRHRHLTGEPCRSHCRP